MQVPPRVQTINIYLYQKEAHGLDLSSLSPPVVQHRTEPAHHHALYRADDVGPYHLSRSACEEASRLEDTDDYGVHWQRRQEVVGADRPLLAGHKVEWR